MSCMLLIDYANNYTLRLPSVRFITSISMFLNILYKYLKLNGIVKTR